MKSHKTYESLFSSTICSTEYALEQLAGNSFCKKSYSDNSFQYVPLPINEFLFYIEYSSNLFEETKKLDPKSNVNFIDVGCGIGTKLVLVSDLFRKVTGIEINSDYSKISRILARTRQNINVITKDALKFKKYKDFDIIYFYRPFRSSILQEKLENKIFEESKEGCIMVFVYMEGIKLPENVRKVNNASSTGVFIKDSTGKKKLEMLDDQTG